MVRIVRYYPRALAGDGGMTGAVRRWSQSLARAGADVAVAFDGQGDAWTMDGVEWLPVRHAGRGWRRVPTGLDDVMRGADLLVLHSAWALHNIHAAAIARQLGVPYLLEPRGAYDPNILRRKRIVKRVWWIAWERSLVTRAHPIHVFFDEERPHIAALGYRGALVRAPNGIEPPAGAAWDGGSGEHILWLGRFDPEHKGIDLLVRAVRLVPAEQRPRLRLHGPDFRGGKERIRRLVHTLALEPWVTVGDALYGRAKWDLLSRASGFVYPSRWEGFGNSVAEAVAMGVPTLVTPYPLGRFLAARGGAILAEATPEGLARGLRALGASQAAGTAREGARIMRDEMSWDAVARSWLTQTEALL
jgi:glycosyltransferase involved in cell wall biosynthesis